MLENSRNIIPSEQKEKKDPSFLGGFDKHRSFTTKSTYALVLRSRWKELDNVWNDIWRWDGLQRICSILWLAYHSKLLTNEWHVKRQISNSSMCPTYKYEVESNIHVLCVCTLARALWKVVGVINVDSTFFFRDAKGWLSRNLRSHHTSKQGTMWALTFKMKTWLLWTYQNKGIFILSLRKFTTQESKCESGFRISRLRIC